MLTNLIMLGGGLAALGVALVIFCRNRKRYRHWLSASGLVVELISEIREESGSEGGRIEVFKPRVTFCTALGETVEFLSTYASRPAVAAVGETVQVLYDPVKPETAMIDTFLSRHMAELFFVGVGVAFIALFAYERYAA